MVQRGRKSRAHLETIELIRAQSDAEALRTATNADRRRWRLAYDEAWSDGFRFDIGYRHWVTGQEARARFFELHGVPEALVAAWDLERMRASKQRR